MTLIGQTIGSCRIEALLGSGGMGLVFRARHSYLGRMEAVKVLHDGLTSTPGFQQRFYQEACAAASLRHANIVRVFDSGEHHGQPYLSMELLLDGSLRTLLQRYKECGQHVPLAFSVDLVRQAAEGLAWAHKQNVIHRDIKPDNLLLRRVGEHYTLKVGDWGLSAPIGHTGTSITGIPPGTPAYMSPEQCSGQALDGRSDVYALGIVLYELTTGSMPFSISTFAQAAFQHVHVTPPMPRQCRPDLPSALETIMLRCLAKAPADRFQSADALADALRCVRMVEAHTRPTFSAIMCEPSIV